MNKRREKQFVKFKNRQTGEIIEARQVLLIVDQESPKQFQLFNEENCEITIIFEPVIKRPNDRVVRVYEFKSGTIYPESYFKKIYSSSLVSKK